MNNIMNMVGKINAGGTMAFFTILIVGFSFAGGVVPSVAHADYSGDYGPDCCSDYGTAYYTPTNYGTAYYSPSDYGTAYYSPIDYGTSYYSPSDYGTAYYSPTDYGTAYYSPADYGTAYYTPWYSYTPSYSYTPTYYSTGCTSGCGGSYIQQPTYIPPVYVDGQCYNGCGGHVGYIPPVVSTPCTYSRGGCGGSTPSVINTNTNTNTNTNVNTNINTNTNTNTYYNIQTQNPYVPYTPTYVQPSCTITYSQPSYTGYTYSNQGVLLSWTSANASSAYITSIGNVSPSGSQYVYPNGNMTYTMTVYGTSGSNTCSMTVPNTYYPPVVNNLSCTISAIPSTVTNGSTAGLTWTSYGANSATLSGVGSVALNGTVSVRPASSQVYTLTVSDYQGRTQTCYTTVNVNGSYVSLTSIPYTGFDGGITENTVYWIGMLLFALAAGFIVVRFRNNMGQWVPRRTTFASAAPVPVARMSTAEKRIEASVMKAETRSGSDTMTLQTKAGETPRLIISRM